MGEIRKHAGLKKLHDYFKNSSKSFIDSSFLEDYRKAFEQTLYDLYYEKPCLEDNLNFEKSGNEQSFAPIVDLALLKFKQLTKLDWMLIRVPKNTSPDYGIFTLKPKATLKDLQSRTFYFDDDPLKKEYPFPGDYTLTLTPDVKIKGLMLGPKILIPSGIIHGHPFASYASEFKADQDARFRTAKNNPPITCKTEENAIRLNSLNNEIHYMHGGSFHSNPPIGVKTVRVPICVKGIKKRSVVRAYVEYPVHMHCLYINSNYGTNTTTKMLFAGMDMLQGTHSITNLPPTEEFNDILSDEHREKKSLNSMRDDFKKLRDDKIITDLGYTESLSILKNRVEVFTVSPVTDTFGTRSRKTHPLQVTGCGVNTLHVPTGDGIFAIYGHGNRVIKTIYNHHNPDFLPVLVLPKEKTEERKVYRSEKDMLKYKDTKEISKVILKAENGFLFSYD